MESPQGNSPSSSTMRDYEVFLSFRGPDTRLTITDSLYATMIRAGIRVFKDDEELRVGEEIGGELLRAISNSKIYVPIFSKDYASSKWCLRELASMVEGMKRGEKAILPIFYEVDASDVKLKTGSYGKALRKHKRKFGKDVAKQWEEALREVAGIKGWNLKDHGQDELIGLVLKEVLKKLRTTQRDWRGDLVGVHDQMEAVMELLSQDTSGVRYVVIHGMGGIGKTTLAKAIFNHISSQFQGSSFLSDIHAIDILRLQKKLLSDIWQSPCRYLTDEDEGMNKIKSAFCDKKVILLLDDMGRMDQLTKLAGKSSWFGSGSRIIITTRNTYFLAPETDTDNIVPLGHRDFSFYEMKEMQFHHALQLFSKHSFESDLPPPDYIKISREIVEITGGLPLALVVIGSLLFSKSMETWKDTLNKLKEVPHKDVQKKLLISYDELEHEQQQIFLDIACHCISEERLPAYHMWKACGFFPRSGLRVLIHLSLIKFTEDDRLWMHDQLKDLGREIVRKEGRLVSGKPSRLWCPEDALYVIRNVVRNNLGTEKIVALTLTGVAGGHNFTSDEFSRLPGLSFLELDGGNFVGDFKNLLSNLTWLSWRDCPSNLQASGLCLRKLAVLKISESKITEDWNGWGSCMVNDSLKVIYLTSCYRLKRTPDFSKCKNLKKLVLKYCGRLEGINISIYQLGRLKHLEISNEGLVWRVLLSSSGQRYCVTLPRLLVSTGGLKSLSVLTLENQSLEGLPHSVGELLGLKHLSLRGCGLLKKLPSSIGELRSLLCLDLSGTGIFELPDSIGRLESLLKMDLSHTNVAKLPDSIGNLRRLKSMCLDGTRIGELPRSIWTLENLEELTAKRCRRLQGEIPSEIAGLSQLKILNLSGSKVSGLPMTINQLSSLQELVLSDCNGLQSLPDLPTSLTKLELSSSSLKAVPDLSNLTNLHHLDISYCAFDYELYKPTKGRVPNPNLACLGRLHKLQTLRLVLSDFDFPPTDLSSLSQLRQLEITCPNPRSLTRLPSSLEVLSLEDVKTPIEWPMFPNLGNLSELKLDGCHLREIEFDNVVGQLENLRRLQVRKCESLLRLSNLSNLKELRVLSVEYCPQLIEIESRPSSSTGDCSSTERRPIPSTLKLEELQSLRVYYCPSLRKLPDIPNACDVEVYPEIYVRRSESGPIFLEDPDDSIEATNMAILSPGDLSDSGGETLCSQISQKEFIQEDLGPRDPSPLRTSPRARGRWFCCML